MKKCPFCAEEIQDEDASRQHCGSADVSANFQAFSHLSRMHASTSTSFFVTLFAYMAYLVNL